MTDEQEPGGAVQSAEEFASRIFAGCECWLSAVPAVRERDAAIRRAAIEECAEWLDDHNGNVEIFSEDIPYISIGMEPAGDALKRALLVTRDAGETR